MSDLRKGWSGVSRSGRTIATLGCHDLSITKHAGKPPTLSFRRDDGSVTWQSYGSQGDFFPVHDLAHYAIETVLGYRQAFYGLIAAGRDLDDFGPGDAGTLGAEAHHAEILAGLLPMGLSDEDIFATLESKARGMGLEPPAVSPGQLREVRGRFQELVVLWRDVPAEQAMTLVF